MKFHIVQVNEKIKDISKKYNVSVDEIIKLNRHINNIDHIVAGMKLRLPILSDDVSDQLKENFLDIEKYYPKLEDFKEAKIEKKVDFEQYNDEEDFYDQEEEDGVHSEGPQINVIPQNNNPQAQPFSQYQYNVPPQGYYQQPVYPQGYYPPNYNPYQVNQQPAETASQQQPIYPPFSSSQQAQTSDVNQVPQQPVSPYQQQMAQNQGYSQPMYPPFNYNPYMIQREEEKKQTVDNKEVQKNGIQDEKRKPYPFNVEIDQPINTVNKTIGYENYPSINQPYYYQQVKNQVEHKQGTEVQEFDEEVKEIKADLREMVKHTKIRKKVQKDPLDIL